MMICIPSSGNKQAADASDVCFLWPLFAQWELH